MALSTIQASIIAAVNQVIWLIAGFGIVNNQTAGKFVALSGTLVSLGFLIVHAIESHGNANIAAAQVAARAAQKPPVVSPPVVVAAPTPPAA